MPTSIQDPRRLWLWLAVLIAASMAFSLGFACAVPLAAFGAIAAVALPARPALVLVAGVWLANQAVGYTVLGYPHSADSFEWGLILGAVALLAAVASRPLAARLVHHSAAALLASFAVAFAVYEGGLYVVSATVMGGAEIYTAPVILRVLAINAAAFAALAAAHHLVRNTRLALLPRPA